MRVGVVQHSPALRGFPPLWRSQVHWWRGQQGTLPGGELGQYQRGLQRERNRISKVKSTKDILQREDSFVALWLGKDKTDYD